MKLLLVLIGLMIVAGLYGWRFHPDAIGSTRPIFTLEANKSKFAHWHPAEFLDRFSGDREYKMEREKERERKIELEEKGKK